MRKEEIINHLIMEWLNSLGFVDGDRLKILMRFGEKYYNQNLSALRALNSALYKEQENWNSEDGNISYKKNDDIFNFRYEDDIIEFKYTELKQVISGFIDLLDKVYPLGTVVELKKEYLEKLINGKEFDKAIVVIVSRFLFSNNSKAYFNYAGVVYPFGFIEESKTIQFTSALIDNVIHEGYSDEKEEAYTYLIKKELIVDKKMHSFGLASKSEYEKYQEEIGAEVSR